MFRKILWISGLSLIMAVPTKKVLNVEGMMCGYGCVNTINKTLESIDGIETYSVSYENKKIELVFDDEKLDVVAIIESLPNPYVATVLVNSLIKEYSVSGMDCMGCVNTINKSLEAIDGIESYDLDFKNKTLIIKFDLEVVNEESIKKTIPSKFTLKEIITNEDKS